MTSISPNVCKCPKGPEPPPKRSSTFASQHRLRHCPAKRWSLLNCSESLPSALLWLVSIWKWSQGTVKQAGAAWYPCRRRRHPDPVGSEHSCGCCWRGAERAEVARSGFSEEVGLEESLLPEGRLVRPSEQQQQRSLPPALTGP